MEARANWFLKALPGYGELDNVYLEAQGCLPAE